VVLVSLLLSMVVHCDIVGFVVATVNALVLGGILRFAVHDAVLGGIVGFTVAVAAVAVAAVSVNCLSRGIRHWCLKYLTIIIIFDTVTQHV